MPGKYQMEEPLTIVGIFQNSHLWDLLLQKYASGKNTIEFHAGTVAIENGVSELEKVDALLLHAPIKVYEEYIYYGEIWKAYLLHQKIEVKLIEVGFGPVHSKNYLNLLELPNQLEGVLHNAESIKMTALQPFSVGIDLREKMKRFWDGHGKESVGEVLYKIKRKIHLIDRELERGDWAYKKIIETYFDDNYIQQQWQKFINRWNYYAPYFKYSPFCHKFTNINQIISSIHPFFKDDFNEEQFFHSLDVWKNISEVQLTLADLMEHYGGK